MAQAQATGREGLQPGEEQFALEDQFLGQAGVELHEQLILHQDFAPPFVFVNRLDLLEPLGGEVRQAGQIEAVGAGHPAEGGFLRIGAAVAAVHDPFEDAHVLAEAGPEEPPRSRSCGTN